MGWQYLFPSKRLSVDPREKGEGIQRRHHVHVDSLEKAIKQATRDLGLTKQIVPHTFRHSFATRLLETGHNIKQVQELLGHKDIRTTMIYLHVMESGTRGIVRSCVLLRVEKAAYPAGEFGISFHQPPNEGTEDTPWLRLLQREI